MLKSLQHTVSSIQRSDKNPRAERKTLHTSVTHFDLEMELERRMPLHTVTLELPFTAARTINRHLAGTERRARHSAFFFFFHTRRETAATAEEFGRFVGSNCRLFFLEPSPVPGERESNKKNPGVQNYKATLVFLSRHCLSLCVYYYNYSNYYYYYY